MVLPLLIACNKDSAFAPAEQDALQFRADNGMERITLCSQQEVPVRESQGLGKFDYRLNEDGTLSYSLSAKKMNSNVTQSHIHLAGCGTNGGVVVFLFGPFFPDGVPADGLLAEGVITDADLVGALAGQTVADLYAHILDGSAYVNVHTTTIPSGEIRAQLGDKPCNCGVGNKS